METKFLSLRTMHQLSGNVRVIIAVVLFALLAFGLWWFVTKRETAEVPTPVATPQQVKEGVPVGGAVTNPQKTLYENLKQSKDHTTFMAAFETAGLAPMLQSSQQVTVFAPTNTAFGKLPREAAQGLFKPENKAILKSVINYHVVPGKYAAQDLRDGMKLKTVMGQDLVFTEKDGGWLINGVTRIETTDIFAPNGVAHSVDTVLSVPAQTAQ